MAQPDNPNKPVRILHAEDQATVATAVQLMLEHEGYVVDWARDGLEALHMIKAAPDAYDLLITDGNMPNLEGVELVHELRELNFPGRIIVLSGFVNAATELEYHRLGVNCVVRKPFTYSELINAIHESLRG